MFGPLSFSLPFGISDLSFLSVRPFLALAFYTGHLVSAASNSVSRDLCSGPRTMFHDFPFLGLHEDDSGTVIASILHEI